MAVIDEYVPTGWVNDGAPAINSSNLNKIEQALKRATDGVNTNSAEIDTVAELMPAGAIIMWYGTTVPSGWKICDGSDSTPDLTGRFPLGRSEGTAYDTGGYADNTLVAHSHTASCSDEGNHRHSFDTGAGNTGEPYRTRDGSDEVTGTENTNYAGEHDHSITISQSSGDDGEDRNYPPFSTVMFIMKL